MSDAGAVTGDVVSAPSTIGAHGPPTATSRAAGVVGRRAAAAPRGAVLAPVCRRCPGRDRRDAAGRGRLAGLGTHDVPAVGRAGQTGERRNQLVHPRHQRPELLATRPNQLWSWDITKLLGPATWTYYYLYVILDVFSRHVVGWMVAERESAVLAERLLAATIAKQQIRRDRLTVHADRGSSMTSKPVAFLLADLGVTKTYSRPHVSNDNPYSEAQFKTLKYRPGFPDRFGSLQDARTFCQAFFTWYNRVHRHSGIAMMTPEAVHYGHAPQLHQARAEVLAGAYAAHPERFVRKPPLPKPLPTAVWINPPQPSQQTTQ